MSSDMFVFDEPYYSNLATTIISPEEISANFFSDPISTLSDSSIDTIFQELSDDQTINTNNSHTNNSNNNNFTTTTTTTSLTTTTTTNQISADEVQSLDQIAHTLFSNSPPSHQLETLSLHHQQQQQQQQQSQMGSLGNVFNDNNNNNNNNYSVVSDSVKSEDFQLGFDYPRGSYNSYFINNNNNNGSYDDGNHESMLKFMQRSYSSNSFEGKPSFWFQPKFNTLLEVQNFQTEIDSSFSNGQMRRVCSTGDLPVGRVCSSSASPLSGGGGETNMMEESNFKVGKYSAEERKERIDRYRAKRTQRNFNKTIKYACRKTLADNRPRIRGRFARNDEPGEIPKPTCFNRYEDDDDHWVENLQEEDEEGILGRRGGGRFLSNFGATHHFQYCGY